MTAVLEIIWIILIGAATGALARFFMPGPDPVGLFVTALLGMVGAIAATLLGRSAGLYGPGEGAGIVASVLGAVLMAEPVRRSARVAPRQSSSLGDHRDARQAGDSGQRRVRSGARDRSPFRGSLRCVETTTHAAAARGEVQDVPSIPELEQRQRGLIAQFAGGDGRKGFRQVLTVLVPLPALWWAVAWSATVSYAVTAGLTLLMSLFLVRTFVLMHDCGHGSLFRSPRLNRCFGFVFGVLTGMPQYVWSKHHAYHHATNGNWDRYRGALLTKSLAEYEALGGVQRRLYTLMRTLWITPLHGFLYVLFFPRSTWLVGSLRLLTHVTRRKLARRDSPLRACAADFETPYWKSAKEYRHMLGNNLVLLSAWASMSWLLGPALFFSVYVAAVSLAAAIGIVLFAVQHNFEHSYASGDDGWDSDVAAVEGTSCLALPRWLNWFTADIAYHHVHHLSSAIPNYRLRDCHREFPERFAGVRRITLSDIPAAYRCSLWDTRARRIISVAEYLEQKAAGPVLG